MQTITLLSKLLAFVSKHKGREQSRPSMRSPVDIQASTLTATEQLKALEQGKVSSVELLEEVIARAERYSPILNPLALKLYGRARQAGWRLPHSADSNPGKGGAACASGPGPARHAFTTLSAYRDVIGKHFPAITLVEVSALLDDEALIEIECTAVVPPD